MITKDNKELIKKAKALVGAKDIRGGLKGTLRFASALLQQPSPNSEYAVPAGQATFTPNGRFLGGAHWDTVLNSGYPTPANFG